jgi:hypothetical protein
MSGIFLIENVFRSVNPQAPLTLLGVRLIVTSTRHRGASRPIHIRRRCIGPALT